MYRRYNDSVMDMRIAEFCEFCEYAMQKEKEQKIWEEYLSLYPHMTMKMIKYMSFVEYKEYRTGANVDMRPTEVIIAEIEALHSKKGEL